ncbi:HYC_CC_PP family protein [Olivibacter sitiensis]|uniref:HYC_CC_PP family protein n=1 Tax=Olivibacter sitiensis TaxID=376470 RepID=UPI0003FAB584|nr:hypothetical protein [Olivibacter sitiensis]
MKRLLVSILTTIYLCTASGFSVYAHFCMDRLVEASFSLAHPKQQDDACPFCGMENTTDSVKAKDCCSKELTQIKTKIHQNESGISIKWDGLEYPAILQALNFFWNTYTEQQIEGDIPLVHGPPMAVIRPIIISVQSFLI